MAVNTVLQVLSDRTEDYTIIRDCIEGQRAVKRKRTTYLRSPENENTAEGAARYDDYLHRAVFYNATGRTLRGLIGLAFEKDPSVEAPTILDAVRTDADGGGAPLDQQAQRTLSEVVSIGRAGLLTDYPQTPGPTTRADAISGNIRPTIVRYAAEDIINWRTRKVGSRILLCLVVLRETYVVEDDGFAEVSGTQYRVLRLDENNNYTVELWRDIEGKGIEVHEPPMHPRDGKGAVWSEIPFTFVGSQDNGADIDPPPLLDIANLNLAHYRNSADYEESVFVVGQPTLVLAGLTRSWVEETLGGAAKFGSRGGIPLPQGATAELLQASPNTLAEGAMVNKEKEMIALGAKLLENSGTQQTATEATLDTVLDNSVLATCARNVSAAYRQCLRWAYQFATGVVEDSTDVIDYELSTDYAARMLTAQDRDNIVGMWLKKAISWEEMRWNLKRMGAAYQADATAKEEIAADQETAVAFEAKAAEAMRAATAAAPAQAPGGGN